MCEDCHFSSGGSHLVTNQACFKRIPRISGLSLAASFAWFLSMQNFDPRFGIFTSYLSTSGRITCDRISRFIPEHDMSKTIVSSDRNCYIELLNFDMDPNVWFVRRFKKSFLFKKQISSDRFIDAGQARKFAERMKKDCLIHKVH